MWNLARVYIGIDKYYYYYYVLSIVRLEIFTNLWLVVFIKSWRVKLSIKIRHSFWKKFNGLFTNVEINSKFLPWTKF